MKLNDISAPTAISNFTFALIILILLDNFE